MTPENKKFIEELRKNNNPRNDIRLSIDLSTLNTTLQFVMEGGTMCNRKILSTINKLIESLDINLYKSNPDLSDRIWIIKRILKCRLIDGCDRYDIIKPQIVEDIDFDEHKENILIANENIDLSKDTCNWLLNRISDMVGYAYTVTYKDTLLDILHDIDDEDFVSYKAIQDDLFDLATSLINIKRTSSIDTTDMSFSLESDIFEAVVEESTKYLQNVDRVYKTGIQRWNTILSPGYMGKRLYMYLGIPGKGKSTILLKSALDIKRYNTRVKTNDPTKRPAVLFLNLENGMEETVERLYNMTTDSDDMRNYTPKQVIRKMKKLGQLELTEESNVDIIIKGYKNLELDTNDLYGIINDLLDDGIETIALVIDYVKRLRPAVKADSEKMELKNITNELKEIAKTFDIPVITAQQINRSGAAIVNAAMQSNKTDVTKLLGSDSIAGSWEIQENSDFVCVINPEFNPETMEKSMSFSVLKKRYSSHEASEKLNRMTYFNHPFDPNNGIRLLDDVHLEKPLSRESASGGTGKRVVDKRGPVNAIKRHNIDERPVEVQVTREEAAFDKPITYTPFNDCTSSQF